MFVISSLDMTISFNNFNPTIVSVSESRPDIISTELGSVQRSGVPSPECSSDPLQAGVVVKITFADKSIPRPERAGQCWCDLEWYNRAQLCVGTWAPWLCPH